MKKQASKTTINISVKLNKPTVAKLIKILEKLDPNLPIFTGSHDVYPTLSVGLFTILACGDDLKGTRAPGKRAVSLSAAT